MENGGAESRKRGEVIKNGGAESKEEGVRRVDRGCKKQGARLLGLEAQLRAWHACLMKEARA